MGDRNLGRMSAADVRILIDYTHDQWLFFLVRGLLAPYVLSARLRLKTIVYNGGYYSCSF